MIEERIKNLQNFLEDNQAAIITDDKNRLYFTGFASSAGTVIITKHNSFLLIDFRYFEKAKALVSSSRVILCERLYDQLNQLFKDLNIKEILLESDNVTLSQLNTFKEKFSGVEINTENSLSKQINLLRSIKSDEEIESIIKAQKLTDLTFSYILTKIKTGMTEKEIMLDMEFLMRDAGSEGTAFDFIVVSGKNSSLPHGVPTDKRIENGDFITMDFGAVVNGYRSDMTRTVAIGEITDKQRLVYDTVLKAQSVSLKSIKPQTECKEIDRIARDIISDAGFGNCFGHGLGHSVGLDIHENPALNARDTTPLQKGMIMTVEPGIYIENEFGVRIEDMVVVTEDGCQNLTHSPKELIIL